MVHCVIDYFLYCCKMRVNIWLYVAPLNSDSEAGNAAFKRPFYWIMLSSQYVLNAQPCKPRLLDIWARASLDRRLTINSTYWSAHASINALLEIDIHAHQGGLDAEKRIILTPLWPIAPSASLHRQNMKTLKSPESHLKVGLGCNYSLWSFTCVCVH